MFTAAYGGNGRLVTGHLTGEIHNVMVTCTPAIPHGHD